MLNNNPKKRLVAIMLCVFGVIFLLYASCSKKQTNTEPTAITTTPQTNPTPPTTHQPTPETPTNLDARLAAGQLSQVHGVDNQDSLVAIPTHLTHKDEFIHAEVYQPLMSLIEHAKQDGIHITIVSAYRSYDHQKRIWERKWGDRPDDDSNQALKNLEYSSFPGTSRHHWGTDVDFNSVELSYWQSNEGQKVHQWLTKHAPSYGFCQTYGNNRTQGYANEDWHWSHIPTANHYYAQINNPQVLAIATHQPVRGAEAVRKLNSQLYGYIRGISPCTDTQINTNNQSTNIQIDDSTTATTEKSATPIKQTPTPEATPQNTNGQQGSW